MNYNTNKMELMSLSFQKRVGAISSVRVCVGAQQHSMVQPSSSW